MEESKDTIESLTARRDWLWTKTGQHQFTTEVIKAELLQFNQEILEINNKINKLSLKKPELEPVKEEPSPMEILAAAESVEVSASV